MVIDWQTRQRSVMVPDIQPDLGHRTASVGDLPVKQAYSSLVAVSLSAPASITPSYAPAADNRQLRDDDYRLSILAQGLSKP